MRWGKWIWPLGLVVIALGFLPGAWLKFQYGKWVGVYFFALFALGPLLFWRPVFPALPKREGFALLALAALFGLHLFWFRPSGYEFSLLDRLSFLVLVLFSWRGFATGALEWRDFFWPLGAALGLVSAYGLWQVAQIGFPGQLPFTQLGSTFGYTNNAAQFLGLTLLLWWCVPRNREWPERLFFFLVSLASLSYLVLSRGRSALLAFGLGLLVLGLLRFRPSRRTMVMPLALGSAALVALVGFQFAKGKSWAEVASFAIFAEKAPMVHYRADVWQQTLKMIVAKPLGVGVDRYAFEFLPFHRQGTTLSYTHLASTPHNEFLRYLAEDGIPLALLLFAAWGFFFWAWWRAGAVHAGVVGPALAFFLAEMLVQFPWQNPYPFSVGALLTGAMLSGFRKPFEPAGSALRTSLAAAAVFLFAVLVGRATVSRALETSADPFWAKVSCRAVPSNWQSCLNYSRLILSRGEVSAARVEVEAELAREPWNYAAIRHLGVIANRQGDLLESCFLTWKYDDLFHGKSDLSAAYEKNCPKKFRDYFKARRPEKYYRRR
jgi:O-antigen ligase